MGMVRLRRLETLQPSSRTGWRLFTSHDHQPEISSQGGVLDPPDNLTDNSTHRSCIPMPATKEIVRHVAVERLHPNPWGSEVGPPLSTEDYETLRLSIERNGIQIPLIAWKRGTKLVVLSGSNRLLVAKELGLKTVPVIVREFADKNAAKMFAVTDNLARRQLSTGQRAYLAYQYQELLAVGKGRRTDLQPSSKLTKVDARHAAAERAGISEGTVSAMKSVVESGDGDLLQSVLNGVKSVHAAAYMVRTNGRPHGPARLSGSDGECRKDATTLIRGDCRKELKKIATGSVDAIVTDPPYPCIDRDYGRMTESAWHRMMQAVVMECRRVLKPKGSAVFILQPNFQKLGCMRPWLWEFLAWASRTWNVVQDVYWWTTNTPPTRASQRKVGLLRQSVKMCVWLGSSDCYRNQDAVLWEISDSTATAKWEDRCLRHRPGGQHIRNGRAAEAAFERGGSTPFNLLPVAAAHPNEHRGHPASTPYELAAWWARYLLPPGGVLLDPFCGSGTMLAAALDCGASKVLGIDKEAKYLKMATKRVTGG
jgi:site-specific DNA-methyltransferase (adenine-specific)